MVVKAYKTHKITQKDTDIHIILDTYLPALEEKSVVAISSSMLSVCEGRIVDHTVDKDWLIENESQLYIPREENPYNVSLAIAHNILAASAGIDESNSNGMYVLWPKDPQKSANEIRAYLQKKYRMKHIGVILTDSKTTPMRWGITGMALSHSGFIGVKSLIGKPDVFGKKLEYTTVNVMDCLASAAVIEMGEADEQTPLAVIKDCWAVEFVDHDPTKEELESMTITLDKDLYGSFLKKANWKKGKQEK